MRTFFTGLLIIFGILLAMSDGPYFPTPNYIGVLLAFCAAVLANSKKMNGGE